MDNVDAEETKEGQTGNCESSLQSPYLRLLKLPAMLMSVRLAVLGDRRKELRIMSSCGPRPLTHTSLQVANHRIRLTELDRSA